MPRPFSLSDHQVVDYRALVVNCLHGPLRCNDVMTPPSQPILELHPPQYIIPSSSDPPLDDMTLSNHMATDS